MYRIICHTQSTRQPRCRVSRIGSASFSILPDLSFQAVAPLSMYPILWLTDPIPLPQFVRHICIYIHRCFSSLPWLFMAWGQSHYTITDDLHMLKYKPLDTARESGVTFFSNNTSYTTISHTNSVYTNVHRTYVGAQHGARRTPDLANKDLNERPWHFHVHEYASPHNMYDRRNTTDSRFHTKYEPPLPFCRWAVH
jgi:hypothetical protein